MSSESTILKERLHPLAVAQEKLLSIINNEPGTGDSKVSDEEKDSTVPDSLSVIFGRS